MDSSDAPVRRPAKGLPIAAIVLGGLGAVAGVGAVLRGIAGDRSSPSDDVWRSALGVWLLVGAVVDLGRGVLLLVTGIGLLRGAAWARSAGFAYAAATVARVLFGFYLVQDSLQPALVRLNVGTREEQLLGAYVDGQLTLSMALGVVSLALAVGVAWAMNRQSPEPTA